MRKRRHGTVSNLTGACTPQIDHFIADAAFREHALRLVRVSQTKRWYTGRKSPNGGVHTGAGKPVKPGQHPFQLHRIQAIFKNQNPVLCLRAKATFESLCRVQIALCIAIGAMNMGNQHQPQIRIRLKKPLRQRVNLITMILCQPESLTRLISVIAQQARDVETGNRKVAFDSKTLCDICGS